MTTPYVIARRLAGERTRARQAREWAERRLAVKSANGKWFIEVLLEKHRCGWSSAEIADYLGRLSEAMRLARGWQHWQVYAVLRVAGEIPNEDWGEAEWDNRQFDARVQHEAWDRAEAIRKEHFRIARGHEALRRVARRLARSVARFLRGQAQAARRQSERLQQTKVAARRRTLTPDQIAFELAKAARARAALRERGDQFLQAVGPLIIAMRHHRLTCANVARQLDREGVLSAKGGPWTEAAVGSVAARLRVRQRDPSFELAVSNWTPPPAPVLPALITPLSEPRAATAHIEPQPVAPPTDLPTIPAAPIEVIPPAPPRPPPGPGSREAARRAAEVRNRVWPLVRMLREQGLSLDRIARDERCRDANAHRQAVA